MLVQIDLKSRMSIHDQLVEKIKELIVMDILKAEDKLPSIREMAAQLSINPNTIQKAYRELERQCYIYSVKGRGSYVMPVDKVTDNKKITDIKELICKSVKEAQFLGLEKKEIIELINSIYGS